MGLPLHRYLLPLIAALFVPQAVSAADALRGAGATFPAPLYAAWAHAWRRAAGITVIYEPVGSGGGIDRVRTHRVDFGATDAPLGAQQLRELHLAQFPAVIGGVVPVFNVAGIRPHQLRLDGSLLADIYLCRIRKWNDPRIAALNPGTSLPAVNITVVHRSEPSGSSLLWTDFLSRSSADWRATIGSTLAPQWPCGTAGAGNEGVASFVQRTRFALGYVEYAFARAHHLSDARVRNRNGAFVEASPESFAAAAAMLPEALKAQEVATDAPGPASWPITGASFILVSTAPETAARSLAALRFVDFGLTDGASYISQLNYAAVPQGAAGKLLHKIQSELAH